MILQLYMTTGLLLPLQVSLQKMNYNTFSVLKEKVTLISRRTIKQQLRIASLYIHNRAARFRDERKFREFPINWESEEHWSCNTSVQL